MPMAGFYVLNISPSRSQTHPNLPKGKEQVTPTIDISPLSFSPVGEMQVAPVCG